MSNAFDLFLASKSPRRRELLQQIGVRFQVLAVDVPEQREPGESPENYVRRLASSKAQAGAEKNTTAPVLGADTIVVLGEDVLEKPRDKHHGLAMLASLSGTSHKVMTAVCVAHQGRSRTLCNTTHVSFRDISPAQAEAYWQTGEPADKAGGYGIQGYAGVFVARVDGSYSSVVGLPLFETAQLLSEFDVSVWSAGNEESDELL